MKQKASGMHCIEVRIKPIFTVAARTTVSTSLQILSTSVFCKVYQIFLKK